MIIKKNRNILKIKLPFLISNTIEDVYLFYINIKNAIYNFFLFIIEVISFYGNEKLRKIDIELLKTYALKDQFSIAVEEGRMLFPDSKEEMTYGEAIWKSIDKVLKFIDPKEGQKFYDLGCGIGRICFFANVEYGLDTKGIELIPTFVDNAQKIAFKYNLKNIDFLETNWLDYDLKDADIIYIAATCLEDETLVELEKKIEQLQEGTYIISVSHQLHSPKIRLIKEMYLPFSWGKADVFISKITK